MSQFHSKREKNLSLASRNVLQKSVVHLHEAIKGFQQMPIDEEDAIPKQLEKVIFRGLTIEYLEQIGLELAPAPHLVLRRDTVNDLASTYSAKGANEPWSSEFLHRHINMLQSFVAKTEAGARLWIDAFLYRAAAITSTLGKSMVLSPDHYIDINNSSTILSGHVDYAVIQAPTHVAATFLDFPKLELRMNQQNLVLLITEAKKRDVDLEEYIPRNVGALYACSKILDQQIMRGVVTNGHQWVFVILKDDPESVGHYWYSRRVQLNPDIDGNIPKEECDIVAAILVYWIQHSSQDLDINDVFAYEETRIEY